MQRRAFEERHHLVEDRSVAGALDVVRDGVGEPDPVVGDAGAHALPGVRQPPMLHVALDELPRRPRAADARASSPAATPTSAMPSCS